MSYKKTARSVMFERMGILMKHKNLISLALAVLLTGVLAVSACAESGIDAATGAWEINQDPVSEEKNAQAQTAIDKALETMTGADYEAVAVLGTQVVAGMNTCILCRVTPVVPDAVSQWALVYLYEDLDGNAEITQVVDLMTAPEEGAVGGWMSNQGDEALEADANAALETALERMDGTDYEVIAVLGSQVVAGMNYRLLCWATPVVPDPEGSFCLVTVYQGLDGNAEITEAADLEIAGGVLSGTEE